MSCRGRLGKVGWGTRPPSQEATGGSPVAPAANRHATRRGERQRHPAPAKPANQRARRRKQILLARRRWRWAGRRVAKNRAPLGHPRQTPRRRPVGAHAPPRWRERVRLERGWGGRGRPAPHRLALTLGAPPRATFRARATPVVGCLRLFASSSPAPHPTRRQLHAPAHLHAAEAAQWKEGSEKRNGQPNSEHGSTPTARESGVASTQMYARLGSVDAGGGGVPSKNRAAFIIIPAVATRAGPPSRAAPLRAPAHPHPRWRANGARGAAWPVLPAHPAKRPWLQCAACSSEGAAALRPPIGRALTVRRGRGEPGWASKHKPPRAPDGDGGSRRGGPPHVALRATCTNHDAPNLLQRRSNVHFHRCRQQCLVSGGRCDGCVLVVWPLAGTPTSLTDGPGTGGTSAASPPPRGQQEGQTRVSLP